MINEVQREINQPKRQGKLKLICISTGLIKLDWQINNILKNTKSHNENIGEDMVERQSRLIKERFFFS